ncbi:hypothetical protein RQP46_004928 [Phenoliferia psychrophenolica]
MDDPRDTSSARENMLRLAGAGQGAESGSASLASFFGGGAKPPPLHKVNQELTETELEVTAQLEREMEQKRSRWGPQTDAPAPKGPSLADMLNKSRSTDSPVAVNVANRWKALDPVKATSAPASSSATTDSPPAVADARPAFTASPASSYTRPMPTDAATTSTGSKPASSPPLSLAAAFGSKASGPKLNSPAASAAGEEGPAHARPRGGAGAVAMPGMVTPGTVRQRTLSFTSPAPPPAVVESSANVITRSPPVEPPSENIEAKIIVRTPPMEQGAFRPPSPAKVAPSPLQRGAAFATEPFKSSPTASLTRLQSSNIVADRVGRFAETKEDAALPDSTTKTGQGKRGSVLERWGRDAPDTAFSSVPSSPAPAPRVAQAVKIEEPEPRNDATASSTGFGQGLGFSNQSPPLVHLNRDRARPQKSTPRTLVSPSPSPSVELKSEPSFPKVSNEADVEMDTLPESTATERFDPSPRFDSPALDEDGWGDGPARTEPPRAWSGPPIGVRDVKRSADVFEADQAPVKHSRGVALPGMSAARPPSPIKATSEDPTMSRLIATQYETKRGLDSIEVSHRYAAEPDRPSAMAVASSISQSAPPKSIPFPVDTNPWTKPTPISTATPPRSRPPSMNVSSAAKRMSKIDFDDEVPRSPGGTLRERMAMFSNPAPAPSYNSAAIKESYGVKLSSDPGGGRPTRSRQTSMDIGARMAAYTASSAAPPPSSTTEPLSRKPSKASLAPPKPVAPVIEILSLNPSDPTQAIAPGTVFSQDLLAVIDRRSGTKLFVWKGKDAAGNQDAVDELARQLGTKAVSCTQMHETPEVVALLGSGSALLLRQGARSDYDEHDPCLFRVQSLGDSLVLDQLPIATPSLCTGFSFILASSGDVYVWHGLGASAAEQAGALKIGTKLAAGRPVTELQEGAEPSHFWHALGRSNESDDYSSSHLWRFRSTVHSQVNIHTVDDARAYQLPSPSISSSSISIIDATLELWIIVPASQRANLSDLRTALASAEKAASGWRSKGLPFRPPAHVIFFPSAIPRDLAHLDRRIDLESLNNGATPSTMDVVTVAEARLDV